jgi:hypothetical protein
MKKAKYADISKFFKATGEPSSPSTTTPTSAAASSTSEPSSSSVASGSSGATTLVMGPPSPVPAAQPSPPSVPSSGGREPLRAEDDFDPPIHPLCHSGYADAFIDDIENGGALANLEARVGVPLTEDNLETYQAIMKSACTTMSNMAGDKAGDAASSLSPHDKKEHARLKAVVEAGNFESKSYLGNQFREFLKQDKAALNEYKSLAGRSEQAAFRLSWAKKQLSDFEEQRSFKQSFSRSDKTNGNYRTFGRMVVEFGGWQSKAAIAGATTAAQKCLAMGKPWIMIHPQSEMVLFLVLDFGFEEEFKKAWSHFRKERSSGSMSDKKAIETKGGGNNEDKGTLTGTGMLKDEDKDSGKATGKDDKKGTTPKKHGEAGKLKAKPLVKPEDMDNATLWREASKLKQSLQAASCCAVEIFEKVNTDVAWSWAKGVQIEKLKLAQGNLKANMTDFHKKFVMTASVNSMKKEFATAMCDTELLKFIKLKGLVDKLQAVNAAIYKAHDELMKG